MVSVLSQRFVGCVNVAIVMATEQKLVMVNPFSDIVDSF